jgi:hypothetical protein
MRIILIIMDLLRQRRHTGTCGQAMIEYMILAVMVAITASIMAVFLYAFRENSGRVLSLAGSEYP